MEFYDNTEIESEYLSSMDDYLDFLFPYLLMLK